MKVFVSHSMKDQGILHGIIETLAKHGIQLLIAEHNFSIQSKITDKIKGLIECCDVGLLLLTNNGVISGFVREEIGYLEAKQKPNLIIYEKGAKSKYGGGFNYGKDYIELDPEEPQIAFDKIKTILINHWNHLHRIQIEEQKKTKNAFLGITAFIGLLLLNSGGED